MQLAYATRICTDGRTDLRTTPLNLGDHTKLSNARDKHPKQLTKQSQDDTMKPDNRPHCGPPKQRQAGRRPDPGKDMSTQDITLDDIDEALMYAALTHKRGDPWVAWIDQLLDERNKIKNENKPQTSESDTQ